MAGEWNECALADACSSIDYGLTASASERAVGPRFLRITDIVTGHIDWSAVPHVDADEATATKYQLHDGDVVLARTGASTGASAYVKDPPSAVFASYLVRLKAKPGYDSRFLAYYLKSDDFWTFIRGVLGDKSAQPNASASTMTRAPLSAPRDKNEQRAIAHILGTLDDKIELNRRMSETLEAMARALFKSWFVDFDPVRAKAEGRDPGLPKPLADLFPARLVDSELGEIPEGWAVSTIGAVADVTDCLHSKKPERRESGLPLLQLSNICDDGLIDMQDTYFIDEADYQKWVSRMEASPGDCVITNVGRVGAVAQMPSDQKAALGRNMTGIRCKSDFPFPTVLIECLLSQAMKDEIVLKMDTGTILDALNVRNIPRLRFVRPEARVILVWFERAARPLRAQMERKHAESRTLAALRDALLPKLISGKLRIEDAEKCIGRAV
jgi:type I restriction enzyme S subunit